MPTTTVIGSGIAGASIAYALTQRGHRVIVIDSDVRGRATDAGAGIISTLGTRAVGEDVLAFSMPAVAHYVRLVEGWRAEGRDTSFYRTAGEFLIALDESEEEQLSGVWDRTLDAVSRFGMLGVGEPERLDRADIAKRFPLFGSVQAGVLLPEIGQVDGRSLRRHLLSEVERAGAAMVDGEAELDLAEARVRVRVGGEFVECDDVVVAGGAWSSELTTGLLRPGFVYPQRGQIIHLHLPGTTNHPSANGFRSFYLLSFGGDRLVVGATREDDSGFEVTTTIGGIERVLAAGREMVPTIDDAALIEVRVGIRPASGDGLPVVGRLPGTDNAWIATGYGPQGLTMSPFIGHELAAEIDGDESIIPDTFRPDRVAASAGQ
jgi:D-amino-acid dehydrogenase